jgi:hypothetical protein
MVMLTRANESFVQAQSIADETRDINDIYKDTSRTRLALMRVYAEETEDGKKASDSDNLATAQKYLKRWHGRANARRPRCCHERPVRFPGTGDRRASG